MYQVQRLEAMMRLLQTKEDLSTEAMIEYFHVSRDTIRRDFTKLAVEGKVQRVHGGIMRISQEKVFPFNERINEFSEAKQRIARLAKKFLQTGGTYFFDVSTTVLQLAQIVDVPLTIYTHSLDNSIVLSTNENVELHTLGGQFFSKNRFFYSLNEAELLNNINFDAIFLGAAGLKDNQVSFEDQTDTYFKQLVLPHAEQKIILAESSKFMKSATYRVGNLSYFDYLVTDQRPAAKLLPINIEY